LLTPAWLDWYRLDTPCGRVCSVVDALPTHLTLMRIVGVCLVYVIESWMLGESVIGDLRCGGNT